MTAVAALAVIFAGLLAGEEFVVRWGLAPAMRSLPDPAHLRIWIALVRRLRVLVPMLIAPTVALVIALAVWAAPGPWAWASLGVLAVFVASSALGTVPINMQVIEWDPDQPPPDWPTVIARWETIDVLRSSTAVASFALLTISLL
ncbi:DUF1772 domain-containing protein [Actinomycetospora endophytica]|uniref:DUF1772 domain-containing protein n=1 Tax=Actinomycetospora endophytica TaxID=2291215 RepID=A0ABS8P0I7_9PSEU|nr:DUF1772 domain-containing protein [Actinomycetospora endophytica]MCD2191775.1 DUF1772 domain-containing protein [Actinomycetospora endophytica]